MGTSNLLYCDVTAWILIFEHEVLKSMMVTMITIEVGRIVVEMVTISIWTIECISISRPLSHSMEGMSTIVVISKVRIAVSIGSIVIAMVEGISISICRSLHHMRESLIAIRLHAIRVWSKS